jgi:dihydroneopterin aldolase
MKVKITLEEMRFHARHGVYKEERIVGATFLVDVSYIIDTQSVETDSINDTISYAEIFEITKAEMSIPSNLIEDVAYRILKFIKQRFPQIIELTVKISKLNPPVSGEAGKATVTVWC